MPITKTYAHAITANVPRGHIYRITRPGQLGGGLKLFG